MATSTPHADALVFLLDWYDSSKRRITGTVTFPELMAEAERVADFLELDKVAVVVLRVGAVTRQDGKPASAPLGRNNGMTQIRDNEQYSVTIEADDAKGFAVSGDTFTATSSDPTIAVVSQQADGSFLTVAGNVGSAVVTYTDGTLSVTEAVDVVAGDAATLKVTAGAPEPQPDAPAPTS